MVLWDYRDLFFEGFLTTVQLTALGFIFAMIIGTIMAIFRISPIVPLRAVGLIYVDIFRNVPLMSWALTLVLGHADSSTLLGKRESKDGKEELHRRVPSPGGGLV